MNNPQLIYFILMHAMNKVINDVKIASTVRTVPFLAIVSDFFFEEKVS